MKGMRNILFYIFIFLRCEVYAQGYAITEKAYQAAKEMTTFFHITGLFK